MKKITLFAFIFAFVLYSKAQIFNPIDTAICKGGNTSFKSGSIYPSPTYQWQIRHGSIWKDLTNTAPFSGVTTTTLRLTNISDTFNADSFKCKVYFNSNLVGISKAARLTVFGGSVLPTSVFASVNPVECPGSSTQLSFTGGSLSAGSSWRWYAGICGKNPVSNLAKPNITTTYFLRAEGPCKDTTACSSLTVVVSGSNSTPPNNVIAGADTICSGDSTVLTFVGGSLGTGAIWKWYSGGTCSVPLDTSGKTSITVHPSSTSSYSLMADGKCGSTICKSINVTVNQLPQINAGADTSVCKWSAIRLNPTVNGKSTYNWYPSKGLNDSTILSPVASPLNTTTYFLTVTDSNQCVKSDAVLVKVNVLPKAKVGNDTAICKGGFAKLLASGGVEYHWFPVGSLDFPNKSNPVATPLQTTKYKVKVSDQNKCSDSAEVEVVVHSLPVVNVTNDSSICNGKSILLHSEGGINYLWKPAKGLNFPNISDPLATPDISTNYTVEVSNSFSCSSKDSVMITVKPLPLVNAGNDLLLCHGKSIQLQTNTGLGYTYSWQPNISLVGANTNNPIATPDSTTTYDVVVGLNGCSSFDSVEVEVLNGPAPKFGVMDSVVCKNATWIQYCLPVSSHRFEWSVQNGSILSGQGTNCIYVHWSQAASTGVVKVRDSLGSNPSCPVDLSFNVAITGGPAPVPAPVKIKNNNISSGTLICQNKGYTFYEWGFESKISRTEQKGCSGDTACLFSGGLDTLNFYYWVKVGDDQSCLTKSYFNLKGFNSGISGGELQPLIILYPNPTDGYLTVEFNSEINSVFMCNQVGQMIGVHSTINEDKEMIIDLSNLSKGIYFIIFETNKGPITRKILKQ